MKPALAVFLLLAFSTATHAQTNFAMAGLAPDDTLEIDLLSYSANSQEPCRATIGFDDVNGQPIGPSWTGWLPSGQATSLSLVVADYPIFFDGYRPQALPVVTNASATCIASAEIVQLGDPQSVVVVPSYQGTRAPVFGTVSMAFNALEVLDLLQTTLVAGPEGCSATVSFESPTVSVCEEYCEPNGAEVNLSPGQSANVATSGFPGLIHPIVAVSRGSCNASVEVFSGDTLESYTYYMPIQP